MQSILRPRPLFRQTGFLRRTVGAAMRGGLDLLFPPSCVQCHADLSGTNLPAKGDGIQVCEACRAELMSKIGPSCRRCGSPLNEYEQTGYEQSGYERKGANCRRCRSQRLDFDTVRALGIYEGSLREAVLRSKKWTGEPNVIAMAHLLWQRLGRKIAEERPEVIVPVPMHWSRRLR